MSSTNVGVKGKIIHSQGREIIANVLEFMKREAEEGVVIPLTRFKERMLAATKISDKTYRHIVSESKEIKSGKKLKFSSPSKKRIREKPKQQMCEGQIEKIRSIIHDFYIIEQRQPTIKGIYNKILECGVEFEGGTVTLWKIVKSMGFTWKATLDKRSILTESYDIRLKRIQYLRQLKQYENEGRPVVFTDESYIHSSHCLSKTWDDQSAYTFRKPISKGNRVIMVHAGGKNGFINNGLLMFRSGSKSGDYHDDMNHSNFMKWIKEQLIPNFPPRGVLVIDNASYHNVTICRDPTTATLKKDMITWLLQRNIPHDSNLTKPELYEIIKVHKNKSPQYVLDSEMAKHDFRVLRLPPYHPELNPIEKIWAQVKNYVAARNTTFKMDNIIKLAQEKFSSITQQDWANVCDHVDKVVTTFMKKEHDFDKCYEELKFVVNTGESDFEDDFWPSEEEEEEDNIADQPGSSAM